MNQNSKEVKEVLSPQEERFEEIRRTAGFFLAPVIFFVILLIPFQSLTSRSHNLLAIISTVIILWITEAIPIPVTALLGPSLCVIMRVDDVKNIFSSFSHPVIFLMIGSFIIANSMFIHGLDKRFAYKILSLKIIGDSSSRILFAFGLITCILSMWLSNTATTAMMFPITISVLKALTSENIDEQKDNISFKRYKYSTGLMLTIAFASSIGGIATPVGTPPNLIAIGMIEKYTNRKIAFFTWMSFGIPISLLLFTALYLYISKACPLKKELSKEHIHFFKKQLSSLGKLNTAQVNVLIAFCITVMLWVFPGFLALFFGSENKLYKLFSDVFPESVAAIIGASLLFILPVNWKKREFTLKWNQAADIDWGTILLFGGGLALGELMFKTGLAKAIGTFLIGVTHVESLLMTTLLFTVLAVIITETTSNTAAANMVIPIAIAVAKTLNLNPLFPAIGACFGSSLAFMLPVSTPPNAIVYGSGCISITKMIKYGFIIDLIGIVIVVITVTYLCPLLI